MPQEDGSPEPQIDVVPVTLLVMTQQPSRAAQPKVLLHEVSSQDLVGVRIPPHVTNLHFRAAVRITVTEPGHKPKITYEPTGDMSEIYYIPEAVLALTGKHPASSMATISGIWLPDESLRVAVVNQPKPAPQPAAASA